MTFNVVQVQIILYFFLFKVFYISFLGNILDFLIKAIRSCSDNFENERAMRFFHACKLHSHFPKLTRLPAMTRQNTWHP